MYLGGVIGGGGGGGGGGEAGVKELKCLLFVPFFNKPLMIEGGGGGGGAMEGE